MTGRGMGLPDESLSGKNFRYRKDRKIKHIDCVFYISEVNENGIATCKFCGKPYPK
jgi:hypothetical protein